jgi:hypothetical protein
MDHRAAMDVVEKRQISCPCWDSNLGPFSQWPSRYTDCAILALDKLIAQHLNSEILFIYFLWLCSPARAMVSSGSAAQRGLWSPR